MADDKVQIVIEVDANQATSALKNFEQASVKSFKTVSSNSDVTGKKVSSSFDDIKGSILGLIPTFTPVTAAIAVAGAAFAALTKIMGETAEATKLNLQIKASLQATDEAAGGATEAVLEYANALSGLTGINDDTIASAFILAKSFGLSADQAKRLTTAAVDLSAATGQDLDTSTRLLAQTMDGTIGKAANLGAEFRNLTEAQLKSGAAVDLVTEKYGGTASQALSTYEGQANRLSNAIDDLFKALGRSSTPDDGGGLKSFFAGLTEGVTNIINRRKDIDETSAALAKIGKLDVGNIGEQSKELSTVVKEMAFQFDSAAKNSQSFVQTSTQGFSNFIQEIKPVVKDTRLSGKALEDFNKKLKDLAESGRSFSVGILSSFGTDTETQAKKAAEAIRKVNEQLKLGAISASTAATLRLKINEDLNNKIAKQNKEANEKDLAESEKKLRSLKEIADKEQDRLTRLFSKPFEFKIIRDELGGIDWKKSGKEFGVAAAGLLALALEGKEGARKAVAGTAGAIVGAIFGEAIGGIVQQLATVLSNGKVAASFVSQFLIAIPDMINGIVESIPAIIDVIIKKSFSKDYFLLTTQGVTKNLIRVIDEAFQSSTPEWVYRFGGTFSNGFKDGLEEFTNFLGTIAEPFNEIGAKIGDVAAEMRDVLAPLTDAISGLTSKFDQVNAALGGFAQQLRDAMSPLLDPLNRLIASMDALAGKGEGALADTAKRTGVTDSFKKQLGQITAPPGFSKGGIVKPLYLAQGTDTVPAMLTPGEMVLPVDLVGQLANFLSGNSTASPAAASSDTPILMAILAALQAPMVVNAEAKVNQSAFADIILQLNRQNARMTA